MSAASAAQQVSGTSTAVELPGALASSTAPTPQAVTADLIRDRAAVGDWAANPQPGYVQPKFDTALHDPFGPLSTLPNLRRAVEPSVRRVPQALLAEWNGCVLSVEDHYFSAALKGIVGEGVRGEREDGEIPTSDVAPSDRDLLRPGNMFRLCVFYEIQESGQPRRYTQVVFRRLPAYRSHDLMKAAERADELHRGLRVE